MRTLVQSWAFILTTYPGAYLAKYAHTSCTRSECGTSTRGRTYPSCDWARAAFFLATPHTPPNESHPAHSPGPLQAPPPAAPHPIRGLCALLPTSPSSGHRRPPPRPSPPASTSWSFATRRGTSRGHLPPCNAVIHTVSFTQYQGPLNPRDCFASGHGSRGRPWPGRGGAPAVRGGAAGRAFAGHRLQGPIGVEPSWLGR